MWKDLAVIAFGLAIVVCCVGSFLRLICSDSIPEDL